MAAAETRGVVLMPPPATTALGALINHITGGHLTSDEEAGPRSFQPMNVNFGLFPPVEVKKPEGHTGRWRGTEKAVAKKKAITTRALTDLAAWA
jgi:methylenetetrahydrofolate--tRNA-(uracil-5-)-methyltransferase